VLPNMTGTFPMNVTLTLGNCTDPSLDSVGSNGGDLHVPSQNGRAFSGTATFSEIDSDITVVTTLGFMSL